MPAAPRSRATGILLGVPERLPVALAGATGGGAIAFLLSRRLGHAPFQALAGTRLEALQARVERRPFLAVLLARVAPGVPTTLLNYAVDLTRIRLGCFVAATALRRRAAGVRLHRPGRRGGRAVAGPPCWRWAG